MNKIAFLLLTTALAFSPTLNASEISGNYLTDSKKVSDITHTMNFRARHCHRMMTYYGGYISAIELYHTLKREDIGHNIMLGSCREFVAMSKKTAAIIIAMKARYNKAPPSPGPDKMKGVLSLLEYLDDIDKDIEFMRIFGE